ncbi:MAG: SDR family oxidoreductase [Pseudomonadota bacterium]
MGGISALAECYRGKTAIVTGAASGIGRAVAQALADADCLVVAVDRDQPQLYALARVNPKSIEPMPMDVTKRDLVERFCEAWSDEPLHLLVNAAGIVPQAKLQDAVFPNAWSRALDVHVTAPMILTRALMPALAAGGGAVVNLGSVQGVVHSENSLTASVSKGALAQLTRAMAVEAGPNRVRVNAVSPGLTHTPLGQSVINDEAMSDAALARTPLGRFADPRDIVGPVLFLGSDLAGHVTGAILPVDGGYLAN